MKPGFGYGIISVSEKSGIVDFAKKLRAMSMQLLATGGTAELLQQHMVDVISISSYTGFPEIMDGRVKTLHPKICAGILARPQVDQKTLEQYQIEAIDLVVVNLYPFQKITRDANCNFETAIENIDIGGATLIRAAAKNYKNVIVIVDPADYAKVVKYLEDGELTEAIRFELAQKAFMYIAKYDVAVANYLNRDRDEQFSTINTMTYLKKQNLRYGENPHQKAAFYIEMSSDQEATITSAVQLQGKELSFNNIADADAALECVKSLSDPACVIVKHTTPCGAAIGTTLFDAYQRAYVTDPESAFGGIIAFNRELDVKTAALILQQQFVEVVIAPRLQIGVQELFAAKANVRLLIHNIPEYTPNSKNLLDRKYVNGGLLVQDSDLTLSDLPELKCVTSRRPTPRESQDLVFAWQIAKFVKSNAIVIAKNQATLGIGSGQTSRVYSTRIALMKAKDATFNLSGAVMASDAFFPFRDGVEVAINSGITAIIQPGGAMRDQEVIAAIDELGVAMLFTGVRHFRH